MAQHPAPGPGQDGEPAPPGGAVPPDWMDDQTWALTAAACVTEDLPEEWDDDPEGSVPADWAVISVDELAAQAEADGAGHQALMARLIAAGVGEGYAHRRGDPPVPGVVSGPGAGFGQGRCLDQMTPEPGLAVLADEAAGADRAFAGVTDDQLLGLLGARRRLQGRQAWELLMAVAEFIRRRPKPGCVLEGAGRMPRVWDPLAVGELRAQLHLTAAQADVMLGLAGDLVTRLPLCSAALRDGVIDESRARLLSWRCAGLTDPEARAVDRLVIGGPGVEEWSPGVFRDRVTRAIIEVNPDAAVRHRTEAARRRRVEVRAEDSGNASISGRELPPAAVLAASQLLTARARQLRAAGVGGGMDELRVLAYLERLGVLDPLRATAGAGQAAGSAGSAAATAEPGGPGGGNGGPDRGPGQGPDTDPGQGTDRDTSQGTDDGPGDGNEGPDSGPGGNGGAPGGPGPDQPGDGGSGTGGGGGSGTGGGSGKGGSGTGGSGKGGSGTGGSGKGGSGKGGSGKGGGGTGGAGALPGIPAGFAARTNLTLPLATLLWLADRPGTLPGIGPVDPALARDLAAAAARHPASTFCLTITDPHGRPVAHGCGRPPPRGQHEHDTPGGAARDGPPHPPGEDHQPAGSKHRTPGDEHGPPGGYGTIRLSTAAFTGATGGPDGGGADGTAGGGAGGAGTAGGTDGAAGGGRDLVFTLEPLAGPCDHRHQATGHDPGRMLRHLTGILNAHCTFPPCRRPEHTCDYEHSRPHDQGGRTCLCEAGPACRHDHRAKQAPGWQVEQAGARGWFRWTTPSGRTYLSRPTQYPA
jgi:hypothetical protein